MKPFYIIGHNPNTLEEAEAYLSHGANAIEPDINIISGTNILCVSHDEGNKDTITIDDYFAGLTKLNGYPNLSLVYLDCKRPVIGMGQEILQSVRRYLRPDIKVVLSVPSLTIDATIFHPVIASLRDNEYCLVDEENDPVAVSYFFRDIGATRYGYANGDSVPLIPTTIVFPHIEKSIRHACWMRDQADFSLVFAWTFNTQHNQKFFMDIGVDGIIVDRKGFPCLPGLDNLVSLVEKGSKP